MKQPAADGSSRQGQRILMPRSEVDPRQQSPPSPKASGKGKDNRVPRACTVCRKRKIRCSGELPRCANCLTNADECQYEPSRRDRLRESTNLNHKLAALLRDLSDRANDEDRLRTEDVLRSIEDDLVSQATSPPAVIPGSRDRRHLTNDDNQAIVPDGAAYGEAHVGGSAGSTERLDYLDEDLERDAQSRATGYVGQNSEVQWMRSVQRQTEHPGPDRRSQPYGPPGSGQNAVHARSYALHARRDIATEELRQGSMKHVTDSTFYLDGEELDLHMVVDPIQDPDPDAAERLFQVYVDTVHSSFPLVPETFATEFQTYLGTLRKGESYQITTQWRAQMNLLLAIGAQYSHLIGAAWRGHERDHTMYMLRAINLLGFRDMFIMLLSPDLRLIQAISALSFYFLTIGHVSRSWITIGFSIRLALALGLHLRNEDPAATDSKKDTLIYTWWSLVSVECLVSRITGRPPAVPVEHCTAPMPHTLPGERPADSVREASQRRTEYGPPESIGSSNAFESSGRPAGRMDYFLAHIKISNISQRALLEIYSPHTASKTWEHVQNNITELLMQLEAWADISLHVPQHVGKGKQKADIERKREREYFLLRINYYSTKMLLTRPCLCRIERRIHNQSDVSANFNTNIARACVGAAMELTKMFPDQPDLDLLYTKGPWYSAVHIFMQAVAILLLELRYGESNVETPNTSLVWSLKKLIRWLRTMKDTDRAANRAYKLIWKLLKNCAPALQAQADEILAVFKEPALRSWTHEDYPADIWPTASTTHQETQPNPMGIDVGFEALHPAQQPVNEWPEFQGNSDPFPLVNQNMTPAFSNSWYTNFDQTDPVLSLQDLWEDHAWDAYDQQSAYMDTS